MVACLCQVHSLHPLHRPLRTSPCLPLAPSCCQGHSRVEEDDIYAAMEYGALIQQDELAQDNVRDDPTPEPIPPLLRKSIAVYQAGKALLAYITPEFEEIARVRARGGRGGGRQGLDQDLRRGGGCGL